MIPLSFNSLSPGNNIPETVNVIIEVPKGSNIKYRIDVETGFLFVGRKLPSSMFYPYNYGFIPKTRDTNGDALDIFVIDDDECSIQPLSLLEANPIGVLLTEDEDGNDSKIIAIPTTETDLTNSTFTNLIDIPSSTINKIEHFILHQKDLVEEKHIRIKGWQDKSFSKRLIVEAIDRYNLDTGFINSLLS